MKFKTLRTVNLSMLLDLIFIAAVLGSVPSNASDLPHPLENPLRIRALAVAPRLILEDKIGWGPFPPSGPANPPVIYYNLVAPDTYNPYVLYSSFDDDSWEEQGSVRPGENGHYFYTFDFYGSRLHFGTHFVYLKVVATSGESSNTIDVTYDVLSDDSGSNSTQITIIIVSIVAIGALLVYCGCKYCRNRQDESLPNESLISNVPGEYTSPPHVGRAIQSQAPPISAPYNAYGSAGGNSPTYSPYAGFFVPEGTPLNPYADAVPKSEYPGYDFPPHDPH
jgi:hypothetical protein